MIPRILPTQKRLKELYDYDPATGYLTHKGTGKLAYETNSQQYKITEIPNFGRAGTHRIIYKWYYGVEPGENIDHKNESKGDNRITNLQSVTEKENYRRAVASRERREAKKIEESRQMYLRVKARLEAK